jgi:hypothetical protein
MELRMLNKLKGKACDRQKDKKLLFPGLLSEACR